MKYQKSIVQPMKIPKSHTQEEEERYIRRIQLTGRGSYIVSVPKKWVEEAGLRKGGRVEFSRQEDHSLLLIPSDRNKYDSENSQCTIVIGHEADPEEVARKIISLYVIGFSTIEISAGSDTLSAQIREGIRDVARKKLVGTELVTESAQSATLQVLLSSPQLLVSDALRRMSSIMNSMQHDAVEALINKDRELAKQVLKIDDEIDRFGLYIIRQLKWAVQHPPLLQRIGLNSPVECLGYRIICKSVERSADHAAKVAENSLFVQQPLEAGLLRDTKALSQASSELMENAMKSLFASDYELAEKVLLDKQKIAGLESKLMERLLKEKVPANELPALTLISESLRRIGEYATDIAEVVLNLTVKKSIERPLKVR
jgi:phosphate uptake regulator